MTYEDIDIVDAYREAIACSVRTLVDEMTRNLTPEQDELVRIQLTEQFRFWRKK